MIVTSAVLRSRKKKKTKPLSEEGRKREPETSAMQRPQIKADVSATHFAFCLELLRSKLGNLAPSPCASYKQRLATGKGTHPRQVRGWGGRTVAEEGSEMLTAWLCLQIFAQKRCSFSHQTLLKETSVYHPPVLRLKPFQDKQEGILICCLFSL